MTKQKHQPRYWKSLKNFISQNKALHFNEKTIRDTLSMYWVITPTLDKLIKDL
jgi:hypothetical protein